MTNPYAYIFTISAASSCSAVATTTAACISNYSRTLSQIPLKGAALSGGLGTLGTLTLLMAGGFNEEHYKNIPILNKINEGVSFLSPMPF